MNSFFLNILLDPPDFVINQPWMHLVGVFNKHSIKLVKLQSSFSSFLLLLQSTKSDFSLQLIKSFAERFYSFEISIKLRKNVPLGSWSCCKCSSIFTIAGNCTLRSTLCIIYRSLCWVSNSETGYIKAEVCAFRHQVPRISTVIMIHKLWSITCSEVEMTRTYISLWMIFLKTENMFLKNISTTQWMQFYTIRDKRASKA